MNITEFMSFDLEWFTTLPGLLITGGVIVLLIALIIFIVSNKKAEKEAVEEKPATDTVVPVETPVVNEQPAAVEVPQNNMVINNPVEISNTSMEQVNDNQAVFKAASHTDVVIPTVEEVAPQMPVVENNTNIVVPEVKNEIPSVVPSGPVMQPIEEPIVAPVAFNTVPSQEVNTTPVVEAPVTPAMPVEPTVEEKPTIYGGVNPVNTIIGAAPAARPVIYGGANPLENTTTLPRMTNHEAYSANNTVQPVVASEPVVQKPSTVELVIEQPAPVVNEIPVTEVPTVEPTIPKTGQEMFEVNDIANNNDSNNSSSEIETLEF